MPLTRGLKEKFLALGFLDSEIEKFFEPDPVEPLLPDLASLFDSFDSEDFQNSGIVTIMAQAAEQPSNAERIRIRDFSGTEEEDFDEWELYVLRAAESGGWTDDYLLRNVPLHLKGPANLAYLELSDGEKDTRDHLFESLRQRLTSPRQREIAKSKLATLRQEPSQSVQQFANEVQRLIHKAYGITPGTSEIRKCLALSSFKIGLAPRYREVIHLHQPDTFDEALQRVLLYEAEEKAMAVDTPNPMARAVHITPTGEDDRLKQLETLTTRIDKQLAELSVVQKTAAVRTQGTQPQNKVICGYCGRTGHHQAICRTWLNQQAYNSQRASAPTFTPNRRPYARGRGFRNLGFRSQTRNRNWGQFNTTQNPPRPQALFGSFGQPRAQTGPPPVQNFDQFGGRTYAIKPSNKKNTHKNNTAIQNSQENSRSNSQNTQAKNYEEQIAALQAQNDALVQQKYADFVGRVYAPTNQTAHSTTVENTYSKQHKTGSNTPKNRKPSISPDNSTPQTSFSVAMCNRVGTATHIFFLLTLALMYGHYSVFSLLPHSKVAVFHLLLKGFVAIPTMLFLYATCYFTHYVCYCLQHRPNRYIAEARKIGKRRYKPHHVKRWLCVKCTCRRNTQKELDVGYLPMISQLSLNSSHPLKQNREYPGTYSPCSKINKKQSSKGELYGSSAGAIGSLCLKIFKFLIIFSIIMNVPTTRANPSRTEPMVCQTMEGRSMWHLPNAPNCDYIQRVNTKEPPVHLSLFLYKRNLIQYKTPAWACKIVYQRVEVLTYFFNDENLKREMTQEMTVSQEECIHMVKFHTCKHGNMIRKGGMFQTENRLRWEYPGGGINCCHWKRFETYNCFAFPSSVYKRHHSSTMESTAGDVAHCDYNSGSCSLRDGRALYWKVDQREQCEFLPWRQFEGQAYGIDWLDESGRIGLTLIVHPRHYYRGCDSKEIYLSAQGVAYRVLSRKPVKVSLPSSLLNQAAAQVAKSKDADEQPGPVTTDLLAISMQGILNNVRNDLRITFQQAIHASCQNLVVDIQTAPYVRYSQSHTNNAATPQRAVLTWPCQRETRGSLALPKT
ncbi:MAG: hypothetical protein AAF438_06855 [Pseudomonadota bacterium]